MALGSTQPLTEKITGSIFWGKCGRCVRLTTLPPSCAAVKKSGNLSFLEPSGPLQACNETALPFTLNIRWGKMKAVWCSSRWTYGNHRALKRTIERNGKKMKKGEEKTESKEEVVKQKKLINRARKK
jgi:NADPH:quinone reductase-like Zn-dependent oxidoreductase